MRKLLLATIAASALAAGSAFAADLPARVDAPAPAPIFTTFSWTGFYVGVNVGYAWGDTDFRTTVPAQVNGVGNNINATATAIAIGAGTRGYNTDGFTGGVTAGYNWQTGNLVFGIEGDINYLGLNTRSAGALFTAGGQTAQAIDRTKGDWQGTLRGRLGFAADRALFFVTGGVAFGDIQVSRNLDWTFADPCPPVGGGFVRCHSGSTKFDIGWTVGGGVEYAFSNNWSAKAEYLYTDYGNETFRTLNVGIANQGIDHRVKLQTHTVRLGLNYRFGGPAGAVVAKY